MSFLRLNLFKVCKQFTLITSVEYSTKVYPAVIKNLKISQNLSNSSFSSLDSWRCSHSFMSRTTAAQLWKGVTSVSVHGRKKGRANSRKIARDLNRGQVIGFGKKNMLWPGLNAPVIHGKSIVRLQELPPDESREKRLLELRDKMASRKRDKIHPLERGWCGSRLPGRSLGPPDPIGEETFEGFDSRVIMFRICTHMTGKRGRVRSLKAMVCVGNKKGLAGFAVAKSVTGSTAAKAAKNKAAKVLRYIERDNNTVLHDFFTQFGSVRIFVKKKPEGYGLNCHRLIKSCCEMIGIKDLYAKVEGPTKNYEALATAFFIGLMKQKSPQQLANEKGLHLVEMCKARDFYPVVIASPEKCRTQSEIGPTELLDYTLHLHNNKVVEQRKPYRPFFADFPSYIKEMKDRERQRNQRGVRIHLKAKYGRLDSFLNQQIRKEAEEKQNKEVEQLS